LGSAPALNAGFLITADHFKREVWHGDAVAMPRAAEPGVDGLVPLSLDFSLLLRVPPLTIVAALRTKLGSALNLGLQP
jgi:hypothetical protein